MTTIASNRECMAGDTRLTGDVIASVQKIRRFGTRIIGCAGDMVCITVFWDWAAAGFPQKRKPVMPEGSFDALELDESGLWAWDRALCRYPYRDAYHAIGAGAMAAKTAMLLGKTPEESIAIAAAFSESTGGDVQVEMLKPKKRKR
jgi:hypothetical protein